MSSRRSQKGPLVRDQIFEYICRTAKEQRGIPPSVRSMAQAFHRGETTVRWHVNALIMEGKLAWTDGRLMVVDAEWIEPPYVSL
ncbi:MAG: hypothetical protein WCZ87_00265 [Thiohalobacteraceae bacterium]